MLTFTHGNPIDCYCQVMHLRDYIRANRKTLGIYANYTQCITPDNMMHRAVIELQTAANCAVFFSASSGLTQKVRFYMCLGGRIKQLLQAEMGILLTIFVFCLLLLLAVLIVVYYQRQQHFSGTYHTRELCNARSQTQSLTTEQSSDQASSHSGSLSFLFVL